MSVTENSLYAGIDAAVDGATINDISTAVQRTVEAAGFSCVRDMVGHGCGKHMHEPPEVPNFRMRAKSPRLVPGMIICIEPMVNAGDWQIDVDPYDRWTCRTSDHSLSAHFENQILITKKNPEILTVCPKKLIV